MPKFLDALSVTGALEAQPGLDNISAIVKASVTQTVDLQQWQDAAGGIKARMGLDGGLRALGLYDNNARVYSSVNPPPAPDLSGLVTLGTAQIITGVKTVQPTDATRAGLVVQAAVGSAWNSQEWRNSAGTPVAGVSPSGTITTASDLVGYAVKVTEARSDYYEDRNNTKGYLDTTQTALDFLLVNRVAGNIPLAVRGAALQTADLQQWQDSTGVVRARVDRNGNMMGTDGFKFGPGADPIGGVIAGVAAYIDAPVFALKGIAGQTADLQRWMDSAGVVKASVSPGGNLTAAFLITNIGGGQGHVTAPGTLRLSGEQYSATNLTLTNNGPATVNTLNTVVGLVVKGGGTQTADLQQWQDSAGAVLASIKPNGLVDASGVELRNAGVLRFSNQWHMEGLSTSWMLTRSGVGQRLLSSTAATGVGLTVMGFPSQTGDLQQWQDSAGTVLAKVLSNGAFSTFKTAGTVTLSADGASDRPLFIYNPYASSPDGALTLAMTQWGGATPLVLRAGTTPLADIQQWQNAAKSALVRVGPLGDLVVGGGSSTPVGPNLVVKATATKTATVSSKALTANVATLGTTPAHTFLVGETVVVTGVDGTFNGTYTVTSSAWDNSSFSYAKTAADVVAVVSGGTVTVTNADLQQWQNSAGMVVARVNSAGAIRASYNGSADAFSMSGPAGQLTGYASDGASVRVLLDTNDGATARLSLINQSATTVGVVVRGAASQSTDLQQWQNSAGTILARIDNAGGLRDAGQVAARYVLSAGPVAAPADTNLFVSPDGAAQVPVRIRGTASQTGDLQQWQNSSATVQARVSSDGGYHGGYSWNTFGDASLSNIAGAIVGVTTGAAATVGMVVKGVASQTADLQQWQDSAGAVKAKITAGGQAHVTLLKADSGDGLARVEGPGRIVFWPAGGSFSGGPATFQVADDAGFGFAAHLSTRAASRIGLIVQSVASQTADLQQWQDSAGAVLARVTTYGDVVGVALKNTTAITGYLAVQSQVASVPVGVLRGAASQTADLMQWQDSAGAVKARVAPDGAFWVGAGATILANGQIMAGKDGGFKFGGTAVTPTDPLPGVRYGIAAPDTNLTTFTLRAAASQTADLQQWQDSAGTSLAKVTAAGDMDFVTTGRGPVLVSPNGTRYRLTVDNDGALVTTAA